MKSTSRGRAYLTKMGLRNIRTNRTMSIASVLVLVSCLMLIGMVFLAAINLNAILSEFNSRNVIMVFLKDGTSPAQQDAVKTAIESLPNIESCAFVSSEDALNRIVESNQENYALLEGIDSQFMPAGFEVVPASMDDFDATVTQLQTISGFVESVRHFQGIAAQLAALEKALTVVGTAVIAVLLVVSLFIISSTVQTTMYSRQQEIKVMKSVGAAPSFIRWPFLVEGIVLGVLGSLAALVVVGLVYLLLGGVLEPFLARLLSGFSLIPFWVNLPVVLPSFLLVGLVTGGGGSMLSITRYLKEKVYETSELEAS
ncbi:MAG: permease-like cell division protein FtsX [Oscillospiraceae bacterium]|jgi:cell division transport system permease protein|nr:permease-like cell division protein FtsX [Oscillospiraceae bacterium]